MRDRLPPLQWLRAFEAAARHLSFTAAGSEIGITQSAISQQIKALEQYLGQALFLRRARSHQSRIFWKDKRIFRFFIWTLTGSKASRGVVGKNS